MFTSNVAFRANAFLLFVIVSSVVVQAQAPANSNSLQMRLNAAKYIGVISDEKLGGYSIVIYSQEEYTSKSASMIEYRKNVKAHEEARTAIENRVKEAVAKNASRQEMDAIEKERSQFESKFPVDPFARTQIMFGRVLEVGLDYIEVESPTDPEVTSLIPFSKILRVRVKKDSVKLTSNIEKKNWRI